MNRYLRIPFQGDYAAALARFPTGGVSNSADVPDALAVYRELMGRGEAKDVVILSIGFPTNLAALLDSPPDEISPLSGRELIRRRVWMVVWQVVNPICIYRCIYVHTHTYIYIYMYIYIIYIYIYI